MPQPQWSEVDAYFVDRLKLSDPALEAVLKANAAAGLPAIDVSAAQGKFLHLLARMVRASRILEIGTLGGYSTIWLARALPPQGRLVTLEANRATRKSPEPISAERASPTASISGSARRSIRCRSWRPKAARLSTSFSSTPTRRTIRPIFRGRCASPGRAA